MAERVRQGLRAADIANLLGVSRARVTNIEALYRVNPALVQRYMRALADADGPIGRSQKMSRHIGGTRWAAKEDRRAVVDPTQSG